MQKKLMFLGIGISLILSIIIIQYKKISGLESDISQLRFRCERQTQNLEAELSGCRGKLDDCQDELDDCQDELDDCGSSHYWD
jgi:hypothetical protein